MSLLQSLRNHPVHLALVLVAAFGGWLAYDALQLPEDSPLSPELTPQPSTSTFSRVLPQDPTALTKEARETLRPGVVTADLIPRLHPGMARVEVEELIGLPPAGLVHPVTNIDGRFVYRASYLANLETKPESSSPTPRSIIAIEFDAGKPGHPLVKVHIPDPMS